MTSTPPPRLSPACRPVARARPRALALGTGARGLPRARQAGRPLEPGPPAPSSSRPTASGSPSWHAQGALDPLRAAGERATEAPPAGVRRPSCSERVAPASASHVRRRPPAHARRPRARAATGPRSPGPTATSSGHAAPSRDKLARLVPAADLFDLGIALMETARPSPVVPGLSGDPVPRRAARSPC